MIEKKQFKNLLQNFDKEKFKEIAAKHGIQIEYNSTNPGFMFSGSRDFYSLDKGMEIIKKTFYGKDLFSTVNLESVPAKNEDIFLVINDHFTKSNCDDSNKKHLPQQVFLDISSQDDLNYQTKTSMKILF